LTHFTLEGWMQRFGLHDNYHFLRRYFFRFFYYYFFSFV